MAIRLLPSRADHVGSFLRPKALFDAREQWREGKLDAASLKTMEDDAIRGVVAMQESAGLKAVTDGEFRRDWWHVDFLSGFDGVETKSDPGVAAFQGIPNSEMPPIMFVARKLKRTKPIFVEHFKFLKNICKATPKMTIPAPAMLHHRGGRNSVSTTAYPDIEAIPGPVDLALVTVPAKAVVPALEAAARKQARIDSGSEIIVGVNAYQSGLETEIEILDVQYR